MKIKLVLAILLAGTALLRADDAIANLQQALKDQGFYYGEVTGQKDADTTAAIRRFQIRNGLQVTGELNDETVRALGLNNASQPARTSTPAATPDTSDLRSEPRENQTPGRRPLEESETSPQNPPAYSDRGAPALPQGGGPFTGTPYETAPPEVQRNIVVSAQYALARRGLYRGAIDGVYGPNMEFSLRAYQSRVGLRATGRLDLETLAALELLPGAHAPVYAPRRRVWRQPPVHGEWIPE
jgi:peptidoglycan hydrolase-like protein with peptidoglycan-binding domain